MSLNIEGIERFGASARDFVAAVYARELDRLEGDLARALALQDFARIDALHVVSYDGLDRTPADLVGWAASRWP